MATATKRAEVPVIPSVEDSRAVVARLQTEAAGLRQVLESEVRTEMVRREERLVIRQSGQVEQVSMEIPHVEVRSTTALERLPARRRLEEVTEELAVAEETVEIARAQPRS